MPNMYPCPNYDHCGHYVEKAFRLCDDCRADAEELNKRTKRRTDEDVLAELERKPRSLRDIFGRVTR